MKKIIIVLALLMVTAISANAEPVRSDDDPIRHAVNATGTLIGNVVYVATAGTGGDKTEIAVKDEKGATHVFPVDATANVVGATANVATLGELRKGQKVKVDYETKGGKTTAKAVAPAK